MSTLKEICKEQTEMIDEMRQNIKELTEENEKLSEQYNKMLEERNSLIDDLSWYRAKVSRLGHENAQLKQDLLRTEELQDEIIQLEKDFENKHSLLSEFSEHIGNKPTSSTCKYFRGKLNALGIKEEPTSMSVADMQPMTELQLTKDSSVQGMPLTNEAHEKAIKEGE